MIRLFAAVMMSVVLVAVGNAAPKQKTMSKKEVMALVEKANTPADHMKAGGVLQGQGRATGSRSGRARGDG